MEAKKKTIIQAIVCVGLVCLIWGGYFLVNYKISFDKHRQLTLSRDDFSWVYQVDSTEIDDEVFVLCGFAFMLDKDATEGSFEIVLHDIESGENYFPEMEYMERKDVNKYFECEYDYLQSGFEASIQTRKLDIENKSYEVLLRLTESEKAYQTGTYISKGKIIYANPLEYEPLDVVGTDIEVIVDKGVLRVYRPDFGIYVYQYDGALYWIAEAMYGFVNGDTIVQYQLDTTQTDRLPEHRLENEWYWDNKSFSFKSAECMELNTGEYRVAKAELPNEYSVERIWTGNYIDEWIWQQHFRPYYHFDE